ncbi:MAG: M56 family metallopeptidase [Myxococcota bacterium]
MSGVTLLVSVVGVFLAVAAIVAAVAAFAGSLVPRGTSLQWAGRSTGALVVVALAPFMAAALVCLALLTPGLISGCHCVEHGLHHPHLCPVHPALALPLTAPAFFFVVVWALFVAPRVASLLRDVAATVAWRREVVRMPRQRLAGTEFRLGECGAFGAVTVGLLRPVIVIDRRLAETLTSTELRAVVLHEERHARRRDPLTMLVLRSWEAICPWPGAQALTARWRTAAELDCDAHAARRLEDGTLVAAALLAVERFRSQATSCALPAATVAVSTSSDLELRVRALLDNTVPPARGVNDLVLAATVLLVLGVLMAFLPGEHTHHVVESALGLAFRVR